MIDDRTLRVGATHARTRVHTLVVGTGTCAGTVAVEDTLRPTARVGVPCVLRQAGTRARAVTLSADCVSTTRRRVTRVTRHLRDRSWRWVAARERISLEAFVAGTDRLVVDHGALGVEAARAGARVSALVLHAGQTSGTVRMDDALWATVGRRAEHARQTRADWSLVNNPALSVGSTW